MRIADCCESYDYSHRSDHYPIIAVVRDAHSVSTERSQQTWGLRKGWRAKQQDVFQQNLKESVETDDRWMKIDSITEVLSTHAKEHGQIERRRYPEHDDELALLISRRC